MRRKYLTRILDDEVWWYDFRSASAKGLHNNFSDIKRKLKEFVDKEFEGSSEQSRKTMTRFLQNKAKRIVDIVWDGA